MGTCSKCEKTCVYVDVTKDRSIKDLFGGPCDLCRNIVCRECSKVTSSDIRALMTQSRAILYFCEDCLSSIKQAGNIQKDSKDLQIRFSGLKQELGDLRHDINQMKTKCDSAPKTYAKALAESTNRINKDISEIKESAKFISDCFEDQKNELKKTVDTLKAIDKESSILKECVRKLETKVGYSEQKEKETNIMISGVKCQNSGNLPETVNAIFKRLNLESLQVKQCIRFREKDNSPILVKLNSKTEKIALFKKRRQVGKVSAESCGLQGGTIYFNEDLTVENQKLFKLARDMKRQKTINAAYTFNGIVYIKKTPTSEAVRILQEDDLRDL